ncbi:MAG: hypothetical protein R3C46_06145 [Hyphomonadaceae bacterium]
MSDDRLSQTATGKAWVAQFSEGKRQYATRLLDAMLLVNEEQVATSIRSLLSQIAQIAEGQGHRVGLYTEREFDEKYAFDIQSVPDATGRLRQRAVGLKGPVAIKTVRGSARIGSEGSISSIISSVIETNRAIFSNHPGPDRIRSAKAPIRLLVIVTDFIGSGARICSMLDKFWNVPTVKSWVSGKRVSFAVVAAVGTQSGIDQVKRHRLSPAVHVDRIAPTIFTFSKKMKARWSDLIKSEGPEERGDDPFGYNGSGALVAFSYRIPNNTPLFLRVSRGRAKNRWRALYEGHAPEDLRAAFGLKTSARLIRISIRKCRRRAGSGFAAAGRTSCPSADSDSRQMAAGGELHRGRGNRLVGIGRHENPASRNDHGAARRARPAHQCWAEACPGRHVG